MTPERQILDEWKVDYQGRWENVKDYPPEEAVEFFLEDLKWDWKDAYVANTNYETEIFESPEGSLFYQFDTLYVDDKEVNLKSARLVAVYGRVGELAGLKLPSAKLRQRFMGPTEKWIGPVDKGHFIAHTLGGSSNMNIFPQVRATNRGWNEEGRKYREMERFAAKCPGAMIFNRPIYSDGTYWPRYFEFGVLRPDGQLWVETFDNERPSGAIA